MEELNVVLLVLILVGVAFLVFLSLRTNVDFDLRIQGLNNYELPFEKVKNVSINDVNTLNYKPPQLGANGANNLNNLNNLNNEINNHLNETLEEVIQSAKNHNINLVDDNLEFGGNLVFEEVGEELNSNNFITNSNTDAVLNN